ncbi:type IV pilus modification protein PilV [Vreelandella boliviensis]|uniref:Type IV pilus modification protein PilV n=1 Tax=Vreelandella boliviensis LC1 TaxID=1072583 RepID=A0A265DV95_9GAMM|nr:type IV pilus modification protein PilV [Halomonas boliviensis]EHJ94944.1 hypothetical protein KUC_1903 [Halomonas boliviensis LC1]OZT73261.1 type IV pilus modification protein PilV [Halomonas boliviensis LC1]
MNSQRGFSLIEALIALVVLSIGLIGVAAMQLKALQSANAGYQRSLASVAAVDAQERLWAALTTLNPGETCEDIDSSAVEDAWKDDWFKDNDQNPLRNAKKGESGIGRGNGEDKCRFNVILILGDDENDEFDYTFRLPRLEVQ